VEGEDNTNLGDDGHCRTNDISGVVGGGGGGALLTVDLGVAKTLAVVTLHQANLGLVGIDIDYDVGKRNKLKLSCDI
jgi:hypothetical protein